MIFRDKLVSRFAASSVFALLLAGGLAGAQNPNMAQRGQQPMRKFMGDVASRLHHEQRKGKGPVVDIWRIKQPLNQPQISPNFKRQIGVARLTLRHNGSWNFSGHMNNVLVSSGCRFYAAMAVKNGKGGSFAFRYSHVLDANNRGTYNWNIHGNSPRVKNFVNSLQKSHDWAGHWRCVSVPRAGNGGGGNGGSGDPNWGSILGTFATIFGTLLSWL